MRRPDKGAATAETAVAMPVLMLLVLLVVQFGVWAHTVAVARGVAAEALVEARIEGGSAALGRQRAEQVRAQIGQRLLADAEVSVTRYIDTATVRISGAAPRIIPAPFLRFPVQVTVVGPVERFRPPPAAGGRRGP